MNDAQEGEKKFFEFVRKQLDSLMKEYHHARSEADRWEQKCTDLVDQIQALKSYLDKAKAPPMFFGAVCQLEDEGFTRLSKTKAARQLLYRDKEMSTEELVSKMQYKGYRFKGKRPVSDLAAALGNSPHFVKGEKGWRLTDPDVVW